MEFPREELLSGRLVRPCRKAKACHRRLRHRTWRYALLFGVGLPSGAEPHGERLLTRPHRMALRMSALLQGLNRRLHPCDYNHMARPINQGRLNIRGSLSWISYPVSLPISLSE